MSAGDTPAATQQETPHATRQEAPHATRQEAQRDTRERLQRIVEYLTAVPAWFLATSVEGEPHVRPFSFAAAEDDRLWFCTSKGKDVYDELEENPRFELSAWAPGRPWIIVHGTAAFAEPSAALRQAGFEHMVALGEAHRNADDGLLVFFYAKDATARICDIDGSEERFTL